MGYQSRTWTFWVMYPSMMIVASWAALKAIFYIKIGKAQQVKDKTLPRTPSLFWSGLSSACRRIKESAPSAHALDITYNYVEGVAPTLRGIDRLVSDFWLSGVMLNASAIRNRLLMAKREIYRAIRDAHSRSGRTVRLLSIASGTAQGVIEVLSRCKSDGIPVEATFLDLDETALRASLELATKHGVLPMVKTVHASVTEMPRKFEQRYFDIVEMIGFLDYRPHAKAVTLVQKIKYLLVPGGIFLCCNICPNPERFFLDHVVLWRMDYKTPRQLGMIMQEAGFNQTRIYVEPLRVHAISISS